MLGPELFNYPLVNAVPTIAAGVKEGSTFDKPGPAAAEIGLPVAEVNNPELEASDLPLIDTATINISDDPGDGPNEGLGNEPEDGPGDEPGDGLGLGLGLGVGNILERLSYSGYKVV